MRITGTKLAKWQKDILNRSIKTAIDFLLKKYDQIDESLFDLVTVCCSNTCRFSKYTANAGIIRLYISSKTLYLYERKTLGNYPKMVNLSFEERWTASLIHEFTHFIQDLEDRTFSEVETTQNELEYLNEIGVINYEKS